MEIAASFICVHCFQRNEIVVDGAAALRQVYVEDCQVCCRPNTLIITVDEGLRNARVEVEPA